jgi:hypothetical protein
VAAGPHLTSPEALMLDIILWVGLFVGFLAVEGFALLSARDGFQPATNHNRNLMRKSWVWLVCLFLLWGWIGWHFFVERWPWRRSP